MNHRVAITEQGASPDHPWFEFLAAKLPREIFDHFPQDVADAICRKDAYGESWFVFRNKHDKRWYVWSRRTLGVWRKDENKPTRRRWFRERFTAQRAVNEEIVARGFHRVGAR